MCNKIKKQILYLKSDALKSYVSLEMLSGVTYQLQISTTSWMWGFPLHFKMWNPLYKKEIKFIYHGGGFLVQKIRSALLSLITQQISIWKMQNYIFHSSNLMYATLRKDL